MKRLITRSDFDGLVCAMILKEMKLIEDIKFVHPKDMQDGLIEVNADDISTNLPYVNGIGLAFDHHLSEMTRVSEEKKNHIIDPNAPSAARVVYEYYKKQGADLHRISDEIMTAVDRADSAQYTLEEILHPTGWTLMNFLMDARTGLGRFHDFCIPNYQLMMQLIDFCLDHPIEDVLKLSDVKERVDLYFEQQELFKAQIERIREMHGKVVVLPLKDEEVIYAGNRFMVYAMYPEAEISIHVMWGLKKQNTVFTIGKSIVNRASDVNIGEICLKYGGGGHRNAGTCQVDNEKAEEILKEIIPQLNR